MMNDNYNHAGFAIKIMPQIKLHLLTEIYIFTILILRWYQICLQDVVLKHFKRFPFLLFPRDNGSNEH